jgi:heme/copper-type cytochrome/quinol oxidase subunit 1
MKTRTIFGIVSLAILTAIVLVNYFSIKRIGQQDNPPQEQPVEDVDSSSADVGKFFQECNEESATTTAAYYYENLFPDETVQPLDMYVTRNDTCDFDINFMTVDERGAIRYVNIYVILNESGELMAGISDRKIDLSTTQ